MLVGGCFRLHQIISSFEDERIWEFRQTKRYGTVTEEQQPPAANHFSVFLFLFLKFKTYRYVIEKYPIKLIK